MQQSAEETLRELKRIMARKGDFPSVSADLGHIIQSMKESNYSDEQMADVVLQDFALTQRVLRLANSAMYSAFGGNITSVSTAIFVLGIEAVGHLAMGMKLLDNLDQAANTESARRELSKSVVSGAVARRIGGLVSGKTGEPLAVSTLVQSLGRLLVCCYLPEKFADIEALEPTIDTEEQLACLVLGLGYEDIAKAVSADWNLPAELTLFSNAEPGSHQYWVGAVTGYARRYVDAKENGANALDIQALAARYSDSIGAPIDMLVAQAEAAMEASLAETPGVTLRQKARAAYSSVVAEVAVVKEQPLALLEQGLCDLAKAKDSLAPAQMLGRAIEVLTKSLGAKTMMLFLRQGGQATFTLVNGHGSGVKELVRKLKFDSEFQPDVVHLALAKCLPVYLNNIQEPNIAKRMPAWLTNARPDAKSVLLLALGSAAKPTACLYLDWGDSYKPEALSKSEMTKVEKLRQVASEALLSAYSPAKAEG